MTHHLPRLLLLALLPLAAHAEPEPTLPAAELVEPALLTGPGWRVQPMAELHGLQARFWLDTRWGALPVDSVELLAERVAEMPTLELLYGETVTGWLTEAGINRVSAPVQALGRLAADPVGAAARAPEGLLRWFGRRLQRVGDRARKLGDRLDRALFQDGSAAAPVFGDGRDAPDEPWWDRPVDEFARLLRSQAGHGKARRDIARLLGVDAASSKPLLRARLDQLAWAVAGGRLASDKLLSLASAGAASVAGEIERAATISAEDRPEDARRALARRLEMLTTDGDLVYALAWRGAFPPHRLSALLDRLDALQPAAGSIALLDSARLADGELEARFVLNALDMLVADVDDRCRGGTLRPAGALVACLGRGGEFVLPLPVDRLSWTPDVQHWFDDLRIAAHPRRTLLVAGGISPRAERALTRRGWSIRAHFRWPGAPPYRRPGAAA